MPAVRLHPSVHALATRLSLLAVVGTVLGVLLIAPARATEPTSMTISPRSGSQPYGQAFPLSARLRSGDALLADRVVTFFYKSSSRDPDWHQLARAATDDQGLATIPQRLYAGRVYYARFDGYAGYGASASEPTYVSVDGLGERVVRTASHYNGDPYQYGAAGPRSFDCSGFTMYVWGRYGRSLPHNAEEQYHSVAHVTKSGKQPGDLIFLYGSGGIYHVGIYAGNGQMWNATHTGDYVRLSRIYSSSYVVGRPAR